MIKDILAILGNSIASAVVWLEKTVMAMGAFDIVSIGIIVGIVGRRLLKPVFGSAGSDKAKKKQKGDEEH